MHWARIENADAGIPFRIFETCTRVVTSGKVAPYFSHSLQHDTRAGTTVSLFDRIFTWNACEDIFHSRSIQLYQRCLTCALFSLFLSLFLIYYASLSILVGTYSHLSGRLRPLYQQLGSSKPGLTSLSRCFLRRL